MLASSPSSLINNYYECNTQMYKKEEGKVYGQDYYTTTISSLPLHFTAAHNYVPGAYFWENVEDY